jgi:hypothetical protein
MGKKQPIGIVMVDTGRGHAAYIGTGSGIDEKADEERIHERGAELNRTSVAHLLHFLEPHYFRASTRTVYYCTVYEVRYGRTGADERTRHPRRSTRTLQSPYAAWM